jgi:hypothetical protein
MIDPVTVVPLLIPAKPCLDPNTVGNKRLRLDGGSQQSRERR